MRISPFFCAWLCPDHLCAPRKGIDCPRLTVSMCWRLHFRYCCNAKRTAAPRRGHSARYHPKHYNPEPKQGTDKAQGCAASSGWRSICFACQSVVFPWCWCAWACNNTVTCALRWQPCYDAACDRLALVLCLRACLCCLACAKKKLQRM